MKGRTLLVGLCCAVIWTCVAASAFAQTDFDKANQEYAQGHFKEAIGGYETLARSGQWSANLFYDLGNAYFRAGDFGRAILNYERALALERHHPEAAANLQIARDEARGLEMQQTSLERYLQFASLDQYSIAAAPGSEIKILSTRGDWIYAALPNNLRGWIPAKSTELVRM